METEKLAWTAERRAKFLQKLENDVSEKLYDLLIVHLIDVHEKIKVHGKEQEADRARLIELLERAIKALENGVSDYNYLQYYRYMLLLCNKILTYQKTRKEIKDQKRSIIARFTHAEISDEPFIPLNDQVNEIRITYDPSYMKYLVGHLSAAGEWAKALYCWIVVSLLEPDWDELETKYAEIKAHLPEEPLPKADTEKVKDSHILLDANVVLAKVLADVEDYRVPGGNKSDIYEPLIQNLGNRGNKFVITPSVAKEAKEHLAVVTEQIGRFCRDQHRFKAAEIIPVLEKRLAKQLEKYGTKEKPTLEAMPQIKEMYRHHYGVLEQILLEKLQGKPISKKLRKLAQREGLLPEEGDLQLLAEAIALKPKHTRVAILSDDKDFVVFAGAIKNELGVVVVKVD